MQFTRKEPGRVLTGFNRCKWEGGRLQNMEWIPKNEQRGKERMSENDAQDIAPTGTNAAFKFLVQAPRREMLPRTVCLEESRGKHPGESGLSVGEEEPKSTFKNRHQLRGTVAPLTQFILPPPPQCRLYPPFPDTMQGPLVEALWFLLATLLLSEELSADLELPDSKSQLPLPDLTDIDEK